MPQWKFIRFIVHAGSTDRILLPRIRTIIDRDALKLFNAVSELFAINLN